MRALVTGADGFVGRWLVAHLAATGDQVWQGVGRERASVKESRTALIDIRDPRATAEMVRLARPEVIYHLAATAFGPDAEDQAASAVEVTVAGTVNVLDAARSLPEPPVVLIPGSADVYGHPAAANPIRESCPVAPVSLYGGTKAAQEAMALAYHRAGLVPVVVARAFNHIGPGQREVFVVASFAAQLAVVAAGGPPVLYVGNLESERDMTDVRDVVRAYRLLASSGHLGQPINVASGRSLSIRQILDHLIRLAGLEVEVRRDPSRVRSVDPPRVVGDASLLRKLTGWRPEVPIENTLADVWSDAVARRSPIPNDLV